MPGAPLSLPEREEIGVALIEDRAMQWAVSARRIRRHPTTIMREVAANGGRAHYRPAFAERRADKERCRTRQHRLALSGALRDRVTAELKLGRSPVAIWANLVAEDAPERVCVETIYAALSVKPTECLRTRRRLSPPAGGEAPPSRSADRPSCPRTLADRRALWCSASPCRPEASRYPGRMASLPLVRLASRSFRLWRPWPSSGRRGRRPSQPRSPQWRRIWPLWQRPCPAVQWLPSNWAVATRQR